jgi:hypothetical protein
MQGEESEQRTSLGTGHVDGVALSGDDEWAEKGDLNALIRTRPPGRVLVERPLSHCPFLLARRLRGSG